MRHTDVESAANNSCSNFPELLQSVGRRSGLRVPGRTLPTATLGRVSCVIVSFFLLLFLWACGHSKPELVTIVFLDPEWSQPEVLPDMAGNGDQKGSVPSRAR